MATQATSTNNEPTHEEVPRWAIVGIGLVLAVSVLLVANELKSRSAGGDTALWNDAANAESGVIDVRTLIVADGAEGTVVVRDGQTGDAIETVGPGENSFIRHVFRGLAHERVKHGIGADEPFRLSRFEDGRLVLEDPAVGTVVAINAFGADHIRSFARILMSTTGE